MDYSKINKWLNDNEEASRQEEARMFEEARRQAEIAQENIDQGGFHSTAERGHVGLLVDLIKKGAYVDYPEARTGKTALHYAVKRNRLEVVKLLLYHGADITIRDRDGLTPMYFCKSNQMKKVLDGVIKQSGENCRGDIHVDSVDVQRGKVTRMKNIDVRVQPPMSSEQEFTFTCRRQKAESSDVNFNLKQDDEICSDVFIHRIDDNVGKVQPILSIPLFGEPNKDEIVVFKPDHGKELVIKDVFKEGNKWYCRVQEDLRKFNAFMMVSRKKKEVFEVGREATKVVSAVDDRVELDIPENAFSEPVELTMEISDPPEDDEKDTENVLSCTSFYSLNAGGKALAKPINVTVPLPSKFSGNSDAVVVLTMNDDEEDEDEDSWEFLDVDTVIDKGRIKFDLASFSVKVAVELKEMSEGERDALKRQISQLYRASRRRIYSVVFLAMVMPIGYTQTFKMVVECCQDAVAMERKEFWEQQGFQDQHPSFTAPFTSISKQSYSVTLSDCFRILGPTQNLTIEFHAKRENYQVFGVDVINHYSEGIGHVQIEQLPINIGQPEDHLKVPTRGFMLTNIVVELKPNEPPPVLDVASSYDDETDMSVMSVNTETTVTEPPTLESQEPQPITEMESKPESESESKPEFMSSEFLLDLFKDVGQAWLKIFIFLGFKFKQIDKRLDADEEEMKKVLEKLLNKWQKTAKDREDRGIRLLLSAFKMGGRMDLRITLLVEMKQWFSQQADPVTGDEDASQRFYDWVTKAYEDTHILDPGGYPEPMSDQSLILIAEFLMPSYELAKGLNIPKFQLDQVLSNSIYTSNELKVMKLFQLFLDQFPHRIQAFEALLKGLDSNHLIGARNYFAMLAKAWVIRSSRKDDMFVQRVDDVLKTLM